MESGTVVKWIQYQYHNSKIQILQYCGASTCTLVGHMIATPAGGVWKYVCTVNVLNSIVEGTRSSPSTFLLRCYGSRLRTTGVLMSHTWHCILDRPFECKNASIISAYPLNKSEYKYSTTGTTSIVHISYRVHPGSLFHVFHNICHIWRTPLTKKRSRSPSQVAYKSFFPSVLIIRPFSHSSANSHFIYQIRFTIVLEYGVRFIP